jgi:hypothetical protein
MLVLRFLQPHDFIPLFNRSLRCDYLHFFLLMSLQKHKNPSSTNLEIIVDSPQFGSEYLYTLSLDNALASQRFTLLSLCIPHLFSELSNPFVEKCLLMTFSYILQHKGSGEFQRILSSMISDGVVVRRDSDLLHLMVWSVCVS